VDAADGWPESLARCRGLAPADAQALFPDAGPPALAYWVTAVRELLEESGLLLACDGQDRPIDVADGAGLVTVERMRKALLTGGETLQALLARQGWYCDLRALRQLSHFVTPTSSPIRFSARFFLCSLPAGQTPRLYTEETSEGFWISPGEGYRRFLAGEMAMAEPAEYGLGYLAQFDSLADLWAAHADGRLKFQGILERMDVFWKRFDWERPAWRDPRSAE
jgi:hypothetical protein